MTVYAYDMPASAATANVNANTRTASCGLPWTLPSSGAFTGATAWLVQAGVTTGDGTADGRVKNLLANITPGLIYLPIAMSGTIWRAHMRYGYSNTFSSRVGVGFADASGNGYFAGMDHPSNQHMLYRVRGSDGLCTDLASATSGLPGASPPFVRAWCLEYTPSPRKLQMYFEGALVVTVPASSADATYSPIYPALHFRAAGGAVTDCVFEGT